MEALRAVVGVALSPRSRCWHNHTKPIRQALLQTASEDVASQLLPAPRPPPKQVSGDSGWGEGGGGTARTISSRAILAVISAVTLDLDVLTSEMTHQPHNILQQHG